MKFLFLIFIFVSSFASAGQVVVGAGAVANFEKVTSGRSYEMRTPISARVGYRFDRFDVLAEYSYIHSSTGTDMVSIASANHEFLGWLRKPFAVSRWFLPVVGLGLGAHQTLVETRFGSQTQDEAGAIETVAAASGGVELRLGGTWSWTLEGRATFADAYSPNPLLGLASYFYVLF